MITYLATVDKESNSDYGVQFYDFPGCITAGETLEEAKIMASEALNGHITLMIADGDEIPPPSPLETILSDPAHQNAIAFMLIKDWSGELLSLIWHKLNILYVNINDIDINDLPDIETIPREDVGIYLTAINSIIKGKQALLPSPVANVHPLGLLS